MIFHFCLLCTVSFLLLLAKQRVFCLYRGPIELPVLKGTLPLFLQGHGMIGSQTWPDFSGADKREMRLLIFYLLHASTDFPEHLQSSAFGSDAELPQFPRPRLAWCPQSERPRCLSSCKRLKNKISICSISGLFQQLLGKGLCTLVT